MKLKYNRRHKYIFLELYNYSARTYGGHWHSLAKFVNRFIGINDIGIGIGLPIAFGYNHTGFGIDNYHAIWFAVFYVNWNGFPYLKNDIDLSNLILWNDQSREDFAEYLARWTRAIAETVSCIDDVDSAETDTDDEDC